MLSGDLAVLQAPMLDGQAFDPFALFDDAPDPAEVGVGRRHIVHCGEGVQCPKERKPIFFMGRSGSGCGVWSLARLRENVSACGLYS
jgi:hypothetical protein